MPNEKELRALNIFFGIIIVVLSIFIFISFLINFDNTQVIIISTSLIILGAAFTAIGIPDKGQGERARGIEIFIGYIVTVIGLIAFFIALINSILIIQILLLITIITFIIVGGGVLFAVGAEEPTIILGKNIMILMGIIMIILSVVNFMLFLFGILFNQDFKLIIIILISITLLIHGISRILLFKTGIFE